MPRSPRSDLGNSPSGSTSRGPQAQSALAHAVETVGDRWTLLVINALMQGPRRFNDLQSDVDGIAPNVLSQRLKQLERDALVIARPYSERPVRLIYELSARGRELAGVLRLLTHWGAGPGDAGEPLRHSDCGTPLEPRWYCPTCARAVEEDAVAGVRFF